MVERFNLVHCCALTYIEHEDVLKEGHKVVFTSPDTFIYGEIKKYTECYAVVIKHLTVFINAYCIINEKDALYQSEETGDFEIIRGYEDANGDWPNVLEFKR